VAWGTVRTSSLSLTTRTNSNFSLPSSIVAGEVIFITMQQEVNTAVAVTGIPAGFVVGRAGENATPPDDEQYLSWWKFADGGETTWSCTHASVYCSMACVVVPPPAGTGTPALDVQGAAVSVNTTATTITIAEVTTTVADTAALLGVVNYHEDNTTGYTQSFVQQVEVVGGSGGGNAIAYKNQAGAGGTGACVVTFAGSVSAVGCQHAFKPGAAAAATASPPYPLPPMHLLAR
jgi:hypothetical protein